MASVALPKGIPEKTSYRLFVEAYVPRNTDYRGRQVRGTGVYHTVRGSSVVFDAESLVDVEAVVNAVRRFISDHQMERDPANDRRFKKDRKPRNKERKIKNEVVA